MTGPAAVLRTERTELVPLDAATARAVATGDRAGRAWASDFPRDDDVTVARILLHEGSRGPDLERPWDGSWLVTWQGRAVGTLGCKGAPLDGAVEIGYGLAPSARGHGVATEAVGALVAALAAAGVSVVVAETLAENRPSRRVLDKLGFTVTGTRVDAEEGELLTWRRLLAPGAR